MEPDITAWSVEDLDLLGEWHAAELGVDLVDEQDEVGDHGTNDDDETTP